jgi:hypothetical protein
MLKKANKKMTRDLIPWPNFKIWENNFLLYSDIQVNNTRKNHPHGISTNL